MFRTAADGGLVLGYVTRNESEVLPTEPAVTLASLTTLGALAGTPRDGRRVAVNTGDGQSLAWVLVGWV